MIFGFLSHVSHSLWVVTSLASMPQCRPAGPPQFVQFSASVLWLQPSPQEFLNFLFSPWTLFPSYFFSPQSLGTKRRGADGYGWGRKGQRTSFWSFAAASAVKRVSLLSYPSSPSPSPFPLTTPFPSVMLLVPASALGPPRGRGGAGWTLGSDSLPSLLYFRPLLSFFGMHIISPLRRLRIKCHK